MNEVVPGLVSTIVPVYNRPELLRWAVQSAIEQTYRPIEIIISDDGSDVVTAQCADDLAVRFPDIIRVIHNPNRGPGLAREAGRQIARGEFIQYLDSDDLLLSEKFAVQVAALRAHPECGIAYGITRLVDENGNVLKAPYKWTDRKFDELFPTLLVDRWWNTHTPLFRRSVCDAVGAWSDMRMSEDWEYEARIGALGVKLVHCPQYVSSHRQHQAGRLTDGTDALKHSRDISRLIPVLYDSAKRAGVDPHCPEMLHFSRWAFLEARRAGAAGLPGEAKTCFDIAVKAAGNPDRSMRLYGLLSRLVGWLLTGRLSLLMDKVKMKSGHSTMKQSWMEK